MPLVTACSVGQNALVAASQAGELMRRHELGIFLRTRRERISPSLVGLPMTGRRRTPGLRREEVANLADVGVSWYTWLEQGRDIRPSPSFLDAISRALLLERPERRHLFALAEADDPLADRHEPILPAGVAAMLAQLEPFPAAVQNARYDLLSYNRLYGRLYGVLDDVPLDDRNVAWLVFTHPEWRKAIPDWHGAAERIVAGFRRGYAEHSGEAMWKLMLSRLTSDSAEFAKRWSRRVPTSSNAGAHVVNPHVGLLRFTRTNLWLNPDLGIRLVTFVPADKETASALDDLRTLSLT